MTKIYEYELGNAARKLVSDFLDLRKNETFVITADTKSNERVVNATARKAFEVGAKPMVLWLPSPLGVGKDADPMLPIDALTALLNEADAWVEFNNEWLLYSTPFERAMEENEELRYLCLVGLDENMMIRTIGRVDREKLEKFMKKVAELTKNADHMKITTSAGTELEFDNHPEHPIDCSAGDASSPGMNFLSGQIGWAPDLQSVEGKLVFDGSVEPPVGLLNEPIEMKIEEGRVVNIEGSREAEEFRRWLESFDDEKMFRLAHVCYGFNPGAKLSGNILEDERVWGCTEWGLGYRASPDEIDAPSHTDGICLNSTVWLDDEKLLEKGSIVHPELEEYKEKLEK
ncbi:MAG: aminopeptidase [Candidatus Thermoplasmatota archaeon]|nr:aminopeptidase [Candidatus Thermoplasmatota archaeon]